MSIDIKAKIEELAAKLQKDPALLQRFQSDPVKTLEQLTGVDLPDEQLQPLVTGLKAKLAASDLGEALGGQVYAGELLQGFHRVVLKALQEGGVLPELGGQLLDLRLDIHAHKYAPFSVRYAGRARRQS